MKKFLVLSIVVMSFSGSVYAGPRGSQANAVGAANATPSVTVNGTAGVAEQGGTVNLPKCHGSNTAGQLWVSNAPCIGAAGQKVSENF